jgi:hypothetical protein
MRATLATSGITGIAFVELGFLPEGVASSAPKLSFTPPGSYIPSQRSFLTNLMSALTEITTQMRDTDLPGLVADFRELVKAVDRRLAGPEVDRVLLSVSRAADTLDGLTRRVTAFLEDPRLSGSVERVGAAVEDLASGARSAKTLLADPRLAETLGDVREAAGGLRRFSEELSAEAQALRAGERLDAVERNIEGALGGVDKAAARWERTGAGVEHSLQDALTKIGRSAARLESLARSLEASPSRFLLEKPAKEDFR